MSNPNKVKGTNFESAVRGYLNENGFPEARRVVQTGRLDTGDLHCLDFCIQAKAWKNITEGLAAAVEGATRQVGPSGLTYPVGVVKRPRKPIRESYVVMTLEQFVELLRGLYGRQNAQ